jgi:hypothetical protein
MLHFFAPAYRFQAFHAAGRKALAVVVLYALCHEVVGRKPVLSSPTILSDF